MGSLNSKPPPMELFLSPEEEVRTGQLFLTFLWSEVASQVIETAVRVYELAPEQADALRAAFRRVSYEVAVE